MEEFYNDIDIMLAKFLSGEASPEEAMKVSAWVDESEENKKSLLQLENAWGYKQLTDQEIKELLKSITHTPQKKESISFFTTSYRWAASIAILLLSGIALYLAFSKNEIEHDSIAWIIKKTENQLLQHSFQDSSKVVLSTNSSIRYPEQFQGNTREVELTGEAYFSVTPNVTKPFIVKVDELNIKVLGTKFNIKNDSVLQVVEVVVTEGKVLFYNKIDSVLIKQGWYGLYDKNKKEFSLQPIEEQKTNSIAYATGSFEFEKSTFGEIAEQLKKVYNVDIIFDNQNISNCKIHGTFKNKSLDFILDVISAALNVSYTKEKNTVRVHGDGCQ